MLRYFDALTHCSTVSVTSRWRAWPDFKLHAVSLIRFKSRMLNLHELEPGGRRGMEKSPFSEVFTVRLELVSTCTAVTAAAFHASTLISDCADSDPVIFLCLRKPAKQGEQENAAISITHLIHDPFRLGGA